MEAFEGRYDENELAGKFDEEGVRIDALDLAMKTRNH